MKDAAAKMGARIARDLFTTGGVGRLFTHLRAANYNADSEGFDELGCGWSEACAADLIANHIRKQRKDAIRRAVKAERERCVRIVDDCGMIGSDATISLIKAINGGKRGKT